jgi:LacI family transcriptional regulator
MQAAFQAGIAMPEGLSIVGFDDIDIAAFTIPPLTTVSQSGVEMGSIAANMVFDMIEHETPGPDTKDVVVAPTLVVRQSTAPVG